MSETQFRKYNSLTIKAQHEVNTKMQSSNAESRRKMEHTVNFSIKADEKSSKQLFNK